MRRRQETVSASEVSAPAAIAAAASAAERKQGSVATVAMALSPVLFLQEGWERAAALSNQIGCVMDESHAVLRGRRGAHERVAYRQADHFRGLARRRAG